MFERGNESRLAGLFRHHLANSSNGGATVVGVDGRGAPVAAHSSQRPDSTATAQENGNGSASNGGGSDDALDYSRCYSNSQSKSSSQSESDYSTPRNGHPTAATTVAALPPPPQPSSEAA